MLLIWNILTGQENKKGKYRVFLQILKIALTDRWRNKYLKISLFNTGEDWGIIEEDRHYGQQQQPCMLFNKNQDFFFNPSAKLAFMVISKWFFFVVIRPSHHGLHHNIYSIRILGFLPRWYTDLLRSPSVYWNPPLGLEKKGSSKKYNIFFFSRGAIE